jgi:hypothetical protein
MKEGRKEEKKEDDKWLTAFHSPPAPKQALNVPQLSFFSIIL